MNGFIVSPGKIIKEYINSRGITQKDAAKIMDTSEKHLSNLLNGKTRLTGEMALKIERVLPDIEASFWLDYEAKYQEYLARKREELEIKNADLKDIAKRFHFKEVFKRTKKTLIEQAADMLDILEVQSFLNFKESLPKGMEFMQDNGEEEAMTVWIKLCERAVFEQNKSLHEVPYSPMLLRQSLERLKKIALNPDIDDSIKSCRKRLNKCGIYLVVYPAIGNSKIRGVLTEYDGRPAIFISKRFKTHDHVWFTIIHELAHLLLHYGKGSSFVSDENLTSSDKKDAEANEFARNFFVDKETYKAFSSNDDISLHDIYEFARQEGVHPGIIVGFLQHDERLRHDQMNKAKVYCD